MNKPISMLRKEFIDNISELINNSGLSIYIVEPILQDLVRQCQALEQRQYEQEKNEYIKSLESAVSQEQADNVN